MVNLCDLSASHYSGIEAGDKNPNFDTMLKISKGFGIPLSELLRDDREPEFPKYDADTNNVVSLMTSMSPEARKYARKLLQVFFDSRK